MGHARTWIRPTQPSRVEFIVDMTASLYVRTPMNNKPTREAASVNPLRACSSQRLVIGRHKDGYAAASPLDDLAASSEDTDAIGGDSFKFAT